MGRSAHRRYWSKPGYREILDFARTGQRVIITLDSDFHTILAVTNASSPSVILIRLEALKGPGLVLLT